MFGGTTVVRREPIGVIGGIVPGNFPQGCPQACLTSSRPVAARTRSPSAPHAAAIPTAPRGPQRAEAPGRLPHPGQHGTAPTPQGRCDRSPPHGQDRRPPLTATVPPSARPAMPDTVTGQLAHQQGGVIPAQVPGTDHPDCERAGDPRPLAPSGHRHALPDLRPSHHCTPTSPASRPSTSPGPAGHVYGDARSTQLLTSSRNTLSARPVRGCSWKADGAHRPLRWPGRPSAICPWTPRHAGLQRYKVTHGGTEKKRPA